MKEFHFADREELEGYGLSHGGVESLELLVVHYRNLKEHSFPLWNDLWLWSRQSRGELKRIAGAIETLEAALDDASPEARFFARDLAFKFQEEVLGKFGKPCPEGISQNYDDWRRYLAKISQELHERLSYKLPTRTPDRLLHGLDCGIVTILANDGIELFISDQSDAAMIVQIVRQAATGAMPEDCRQILRDTRKVYAQQFRMKIETD